MTKIYEIDGKYHREDGPAIEFDDGTRYWFLDDVGYTFEQYFELIKPKMTQKEQILFKLKYN
jgi:hypothetical protein